VIRLATIDDVPQCLEMGRAFHEESKTLEIEFDKDSAEKTLLHLMSDKNSVLLVVERDGRLIGMAAAMAYPHYLNLKTKVAQEMFWWVAPEARGGMSGVKLLGALESWADEAGCSALTMICLPIDGPAETIYQRSGYRAVERSYIKRV
jgi:GNAT superfamily N-acetyltransferase